MAVISHVIDSGGTVAGLFIGIADRYRAGENIIISSDDTGLSFSVTIFFRETEKRCQETTKSMKRELFPDLVISKT